MLRLRTAAVKPEDVDDKVVDARAVGAVYPLAAVADAVDIAVESDGGADGHAGLVSSGQTYRWGEGESEREQRNRPYLSRSSNTVA